jgi:hypothetical protein
MLAMMLLRWSSLDFLDLCLCLKSSIKVAK